MSQMDLFYELFSGLPRQGPGDSASTLRALSMVPPLGPDDRVLDLGCGTGAQTLVLARHCKARILAIDDHAPFIEELFRNTQAGGLSLRVEARVADMKQLDLPDEQFELLWSEGALFVTGFEAGLQLFRRLLKPGGHFAATEATWLTDRAPPECRAFWQRVYPAISDVAGNLEAIRRSGYSPVGHFVLPASAWLNEYYAPLERNLAQFRLRYAGNAEATGLADHLAEEIDMFKKHHEHYGYVFYVMRRAPTEGP